MNDWLGDRIDQIYWALSDDDRGLILSGGWDYSRWDCCDEARNEITDLVRENY